MKLTAKQEAFAQAVARGSSASNAFRQAFGVGRYSPKTIHEKASRLLHTGKVEARVAALKAPALLAAQETVDVDVQTVVFENIRVGLSDFRKLFNPDTGELRPPHELDDDTAAAVASVKVRKLYGEGKDSKGEIGTVTEIKFWDKGAALDRLMKHFGGYEKDKDNKQKADPLANIPRQVLQEIHDRLVELAEERIGER